MKPIITEVWIRAQARELLAACSTTADHPTADGEADARDPAREAD